jgi:hypothetical protein
MNYRGHHRWPLDRVLCSRSKSRFCCCLELGRLLIRRCRLTDCVDDVCSKWGVKRGRGSSNQRVDPGMHESGTFSEYLRSFLEWDECAFVLVPKRACCMAERSKTVLSLPENNMFRLLLLANRRPCNIRYECLITLIRAI